MPATPPKPKIRPFRHVSKRNLRAKRGLQPPAKGFVYLESDRQGVRLPLINRHGRLNGAFELPDGRILEIRHDLQNHDRIWYNGFNAYIGNELVGYIDESIQHREVFAFDRAGRPLQRLGIASALFDVAEPLAAKRTGVRTPGGVKIRLKTQKKSTSRLLRGRGYKANNAPTRNRLREPDFPASPGDDTLELSLAKRVAPMRQSEPDHYHRIRINGPNGTPKWLVIPVQTEKKNRKK